MILFGACKYIDFWLFVYVRAKRIRLAFVNKATNNAFNNGFKFWGSKINLRSSSVCLYIPHMCKQNNVSPNIIAPFSTQRIHYTDFFYIGLCQFRTESAVVFIIFAHKAKWKWVGDDELGNNTQCGCVIIHVSLWNEVLITPLDDAPR